jgi:hypothetical protein
MLWQTMAAEDLAWLLARLPTREAQQEFVSLLRYAVAGIPAGVAEPTSPHVAGVEEFSIPRWPFSFAFQRNGERITILRLLPRYGGFAGAN